MPQRRPHVHSGAAAALSMFRCPYGPLGERIMSLLVPACASSASQQPSRTYYQVLDISPDELDPKVIEEAALRCSNQARTYQLTRESECTLRLNEIAQAMITLLDPVCRQEYDRSLDRTGGSEREQPG